MAARKKSVRVVEVGESPAVPSSMVEAIRGGNRWATLAALRMTVAKKLDDPETNGTAMAALANRLIQVESEIERIEKAAAEEAKEGAVVDDGKFDAEAV